mmetsp:Transcript_36643/g.74401  ORF Transcript_36643/g.74401 Transcript_36643/m.74401 type:complete len:250 (+) Transcript_36643:471-1220(+)
MAAVNPTHRGSISHLSPGRRRNTPEDEHGASTSATSTDSAGTSSSADCSSGHKIFTEIVSSLASPSFSIVAASRRFLSCALLSCTMPHRWRLPPSCFSRLTSTSKDKTRPRIWAASRSLWRCKACCLCSMDASANVFPPFPAHRSRTVSPACTSTLLAMNCEPWSMTSNHPSVHAPKPRKVAGRPPVRIRPVSHPQACPAAPATTDNAPEPAEVTTSFSIRLLRVSKSKHRMALRLRVTGPGELLATAY